MRRLLAALLICVNYASLADAGAWLREPGHAFSSVSSTFRKTDGAVTIETSIYADYGVAPRLTLGVDYNQRPGLAGHFLIFARLPLGRTDGRTRIALELGAGGHHRLGQWNGMLKSTLSLGHGFSNRWGDGWLAVDAGVEWRSGNPDPVFKLDSTLGLSSLNLSSLNRYSGRFRPILQIETAHIRGNPMIWALTPGVIIDGPFDISWLAGIEYKSSLETSVGLKLGLWRQF